MDFIEIKDRLGRIEKLLIGQKEVLTFDEVADYTGLSKSHLYKLTSSRGIPCYKPSGRLLYFKKSEIDAWLLNGKKKTAEELDIEAESLMLQRGK